MKIALNDFKNESHLSLVENIEPKALDADVGVMHFSEPIRVEAEAWLSDKELVVQVKIRGERRFACSRCLEEFNKLFEKETTLYYDIGDLKVISLDPNIREEIILDHPIQVLCRQECRGLCAGCGVNLNEAPCRCPSKDKDSE